MRFRLTLALMIFAGLLQACGGGGGDGGSPDSGDPEPTDNPDVALVLVSGHQGLFDGQPSLSYLHEDLGPAMVSDLTDAGFSVEIFYFVDGREDTDYPGYLGLLDRLSQIRDDWVFGVQDATRVVVVSHSHGGVWATAALRQVGNLPVAAHIALDHSSLAWDIVGHDTSLIGGSPQDALEIQALASCSSFPGVPSEQDFFYDLEDVVMPSVAAALEVRSGDSPPFGFEMYDERWNVRLDGTLGGLSCYYSGDTHSEVHEVTGTTYPFVLSWLLGQL